MPRRLTQEEAAKRFADAGGELCGPYQGSSKRSLCRCTCGDLMEMTLDSFVRGYRCQKCARRTISEKVSKMRSGAIHSQERIAAKLQQRGCELLSEYKGLTETFKYRCKCGSIGEKTWKAFKKSYRCQACGKRSRKYTLEEARELCASQGKELLSEHYKDSREKIRVRCGCGKEYTTTLSSIQCGKSCKKCGDLKRSGSNHSRWIADRDARWRYRWFAGKCRDMLRRVLNRTGIEKTTTTIQILGYGGQELRKHLESHPNWPNVDPNRFDIDHVFPVKAFLDHGINDPALINCLDNVQPLSSADNLLKGDKYDQDAFIEWLKNKGTCGSFTAELTEWLKSLNITYMTESGLIRVNNIVIKHVDLSKKWSRLHNFEDYDLHRRMGLHLVTVFSDEWLARKSQCKNYLRSLLGEYELRIGARECGIGKIDFKSAAAFLEEHHIQGANNLGLEVYGLWRGDLLLAVMSLGRHHRHQENGSVILSRLCYRDGVQVIGGSARLFARCKEWAVNNGFKSIVSFSDNRWTVGNVYESLDFTCDAELRPDYSYVHELNPQKRLSKQSQLKQKVNCPPDKTELEWATERGLYRIWDCGKKRWTYQLT